MLAQICRDELVCVAIWRNIRAPEASRRILRTAAESFVQDTAPHVIRQAAREEASAVRDYGVLRRDLAWITQAGRDRVRIMRRATPGTSWSDFGRHRALGDL